MRKPDVLTCLNSVIVLPLTKLGTLEIKMRILQNFQLFQYFEAQIKKNPLEKCKIFHCHKLLSEKTIFNINI